jgi:hypothetical protein
LLGEGVDKIGMVSKKALCEERAHLIDAKFLGRLTVAQGQRLAEIETELDRRDAPRLARMKKQRDAEFAAVDRQIADLKAKIEKNASGRPQTKTAGSH